MTEFLESPGVPPPPADEPAPADVAAAHLARALDLTDLRIVRRALEILAGNCGGWTPRLSQLSRLCAKASEVGSVPSPPPPRVRKSSLIETNDFTAGRSVAEDAVDTREASDILHLTPRRIRQLCELGVFGSAARKSSRWLLSKAEVVRYEQEMAS